MIVWMMKSRFKQIMTNKQKSDLARAIGLTQGILHIRDWKDFDKKGLIIILEEIDNILNGLMEENDNL